MTPTPRTDEEVEIAKKFPGTAHGLWVSAEFCRQMERELIEERRVRENAQKHHASTLEELDAARATRPEGALPTLPSGWLAVPVRPTIEMHNAAAFSDIYESPMLTMDDEGYIRIVHAAPDWSRVWRAMVEAAVVFTSEGRRMKTLGDYLTDMVTVPEKPTEAMLRPFYNCQPDELEIAWAAMIAIVRAHQRSAAAEHDAPKEKP